MSTPDVTAAEILALAERQPVYRCFADDGTLLYIGTGQFLRRLAEHAQKTWFLAVTKITLEWYPNEQLALGAERHAIETEKPKHNIVHNGTTTVVALRAWRPERLQGPVTISEALATGFLPGYESNGAVRMAKHRNPQTFPPVLGTRGTVNLYDAEALRKWALQTKRRSAPRRRKRAR